ncbi:MAG: tetratricopeptide repeat protein [Candidatus Acidiferrales bacterium]
MKQKILFLLLLMGCLAGSVPLRAQQNATDDLIKNLQARVKRNPEDHAGYASLGAAYLQKGRETADAADYELAKGALEKSLDLLSNDPAAAFAMTQMAVVGMVEHRFEDALTWAQRALALGSGDPSPWAIAGDALADVGDYKGASEAYSRLQSSFGSEDQKLALSYQRDSRMSFLRFVAGDTQGAIQLMRSAVRTAMETHMPPENIAWSEYQLGEEFFLAGETKAAEKAYLASLDECPNYYRALAGLAKVRASQGRYIDAVKLYQGAIARVPYPEYAAALGDIYYKLGQIEDAKKQYALVEFIGYLSQLNQQIHNRDLALFYADHGLKLNESLALAQKELEVRRDIYTWDVLAWSLLKNDKPQEAAQAISHALEQGTKDPHLFFHAGMIYERLGDSPKAKDYLQRALETNPEFHITYAEIARQTLDRMNEGQPAVSAQEAGNAQ